MANAPNANNVIIFGPAEPKILCRFVYNANTPGIFIFENIEVANAFNSNIFNPDKALSHVALIIYCTPKFNQSDFHYVKMLVDQIHNYCKNHPEDILNTLSQLENWLKQNIPVPKEITFLACQILYSAMIKDDPSLSPTEN